MKTSITPISAGQQKQCVRVIEDAAHAAGEAAIAELAQSGVLNKDNLQRVLGWGDKLVPAIQRFVKEQIAALAENISGCLKLISGAETLTLDSTDGEETIAKADDLFTGFLDSDFVNYGCDVKSAATGQTNVTVHEMIKDGDFRKIFGGLSDDLNKLVLTQPQIIQFVKKYRKWLRTDGWGTFFLFKVGDVLFVARVDVRGGGSLGVGVLRFGDGGVVWGAGFARRVVVPQQTLAS